MKILLVVTRAQLGGAQNFVYDLAKNLSEKNISVTVAVGEDGYLPNKLEKINISVHIFRSLKRTLNPLNNIFYIFEIKRYLDENNFDIVHFNSSNALLGSIGAKIAKNKPKTLFTYHGLSILDENYKINPLFRFFYKTYFRILMKFINSSVFVCRANLETINNMGIKTDSHVVYNSTNNTDFFTKEEAIKIIEKKINHNLKHSFILGSIGRLSYQKNYEFLISIFPQIKDRIKNAKLLIAGDGENKEKYLNLIKKNKLEDRVFLLGSLENAHKIIPAFDIFVLPSRYEGMSITLIEALFAEVPILATDVGGNRETIRKTESQIYKLNSKKEFLDKLLKIHDSKELRAELVEENLGFSEEFTVSNMTDSYFQIYKSLTQK